jgi:hypothetical protein
MGLENVFEMVVSPGEYRLLDLITVHGKLKPVLLGCISSSLMT